MERNHARFLQDSCKILVRIIQKSCKIIQDPKKIFARSCNNYPRITQESGKYYPKIMQESCNINLRIMQDVMRCVTIAFYCSQKITDNNSIMCSKCPLSTCVPTNRNYSFYKTFSVSNNDSALSSKALGKANFT